MVARKDTAAKKETAARKDSAWLAFPYPDKRYRYAGDALEKHWDRLHLGDREPYPSAQTLAQWCKGNSALAASIPAFHGDFAALSGKLCEAWRLYHRGEFGEATEVGVSLGPIGYAAANKAAAIYANYVEKKPAARLRLLQEAAARAEQASALLPQHANSWYLYAYALGRYSQGKSVMEAIASGTGGKIKHALDRTLALEPGHAEAHTAVGTYHAEIVDKAGAVLGGLAYGASRDEAVRHYQKALKLHPQSAIARIEYANGLLMLFGDSRLDEATRLYVEASEIEPRDAMERLDVELAKSQLEEDDS